jgi:hypothetical protein
MRLPIIALVVAVGCTDPVGYGGTPVEDSGVVGTTAAGIGSATGGATGSATGGATGSATGAGTGTGTGTGTGSGSGTGTGTGTGSGTGSWGTGSTPVGGCTVDIPADAIVVEEDLVSADDGEFYWVCKSSVFSYSGSFSQILVMDGADAVINGVANTTWALNSSNVALFIDPNAITHEPSAAVQDLSTNGAVLNPCTTITVNTASAPTPGCAL